VRGRREERVCVGGGGAKVEGGEKRLSGKGGVMFGSEGGRGWRGVGVGGRQWEWGMGGFRTGVGVWDMGERGCGGHGGVGRGGGGVRRVGGGGGRL